MQRKSGFCQVEKRIQVFVASELFFFSGRNITPNITFKHFGFVREIVRNSHCRRQSWSIRIYLSSKSIAWTSSLALATSLFASLFLRAILHAATRVVNETSGDYRNHFIAPNAWGIDWMDRLTSGFERALVSSPFFRCNEERTNGNSCRVFVQAKRRNLP